MSDIPKAPPDGATSSAEVAAARATPPKDSPKESSEHIPELKAELVRELRPIISRPQDVERAANAVMSVFVQESYHSGPLPSAREVGRYNEVIANGGERIMQMAEKEQALDHEMARAAMRANTNFVYLGMVFAFVLSFGFIAAGVYCAGLGKEIAAVAMVGAGAAGIIASFIRPFANRGAQQSEPSPPTPARRPPQSSSRKKGRSN